MPTGEKKMASTIKKKITSAKFASIKVNKGTQFRNKGINADPKIINELENSIRDVGLKNLMSVEYDSSGVPWLIDGFHRHIAIGRLHRQQINNPNGNPYETVKVYEVSFTTDSESTADVKRRKYQFEVNIHAHNICTPNNPNDVASYLATEAMDSTGMFGKITLSCQTSVEKLSDDMDAWTSKNLKGGKWTKKTKRDVVSEALEQLNVQSTGKMHLYDTISAVNIINGYVPNWNGVRSLEISGDKKVICGVVTSNDKHVKCSHALAGLIREFGTGVWTMKNLPTIKLFGYANVKSDKSLDSTRKSMTKYVQEFNEWCKNNIAVLNGRDLVELYGLPQKMNRGKNTENSIFRLV
jgi:hypothetical protein